MTENYLFVYSSRRRYIRRVGRKWRVSRAGRMEAMMVYFIQQAASERGANRQAAVLPVSLAELAKRRFAFALGRFGERVESLSIRLRDLNGPRGGEDQLCLVSVRLRGSRREVVVRETDADAATAISRAAERTARAVARVVATVHDWRRPSRRAR
jgi:putative sigma-54 modulation protein